MGVSLRVTGLVCPGNVVNFSVSASNVFQQNNLVPLETETSIFLGNLYHVVKLPVPILKEATWMVSLTWIVIETATMIWT